MIHISKKGSKKIKSFWKHKKKEGEEEEEEEKGEVQDFGRRRRRARMHSIIYI
jgi:hypothetical protein